MDKSAKILLLGKTGVGKSSFINYFIGCDSATHAVGRPVTQEYFTEYTNHDGKYPIIIFDSKGVEALIGGQQLDYLKREISKRNNSDDIMNWFHTIFYCVSMANARFEPYEIDLIKTISNEISQHIHIILTNCDACDKSSIENMKKRIYEIFGKNNNIRVFEVVSVEIRKRNGTVTSRYGKEAIVDSVFDLLWSDISDKISHDFASEALYRIKSVINYSFYFLNDFIDDTFKLSTYIKVIKDEDSVNDKIDKKMDDMNDEIDKELNKMTEKLKNIVKPLSELYMSYKGVVDGDYVYNNLDFNAFSLISDKLDEVFTEDDFEKLFPNMASFDYIDDDDILGIMKTVVGSLGEIVFAKKKLKTYLADGRRRILDDLPSESELYDSVYGTLMEVANISYDKTSRNKNNNRNTRNQNSYLKDLEDLVNSCNNTVSLADLEESVYDI